MYLLLLSVFESWNLKMCIYISVSTRYANEIEDLGGAIKEWWLSEMHIFPHLIIENKILWNT